MTSNSEQQKIARIKNNYGNYIDNWLSIKDNDRKEILSYLAKITDKDLQNRRDNNEPIQDTIVINQGELGVVVNLKKFKALSGLDLEGAKQLLSILKEEEQKDPVAHYQHIFSDIQLRQNSGSISLFKENPGSMDVKQELLQGLTRALEKEQKKATKTNSLIVKGKVMAHKIMLGKKVRKILDTFTPLEQKQKLSIKTFSKTEYQNGVSINNAEIQHKVELLQDIQKYIMQDKSEIFNLDKFNNSIDILYRYHRNELQLLNHPELIRVATHKHEQALLDTSLEATKAVNNAENISENSVEAKGKENIPDQLLSMNAEVGIQEKVVEELAPEKSKEVKKEIPTQEQLMKLDIKLEEMKRTKKELTQYREELLSSNAPLKETFVSKIKKTVLPGHGSARR